MMMILRSHLGTWSASWGLIHMSAIFAGTCDKCGKSFWYSFGHPDWWKRHLNPTWDRWVALQGTNTCAVCGSPEWDALTKKETNEKEKANNG